MLDDLEELNTSRFNKEKKSLEVDPEVWDAEGEHDWERFVPYDSEGKCAFCSAPVHVVHAWGFSNGKDLCKKCIDEERAVIDGWLRRAHECENRAEGAEQADQSPDRRQR